MSSQIIDKPLATVTLICTTSRRKAKECQCGSARGLAVHQKWKQKHRARGASRGAQVQGAGWIECEGPDKYEGGMLEQARWGAEVGAGRDRGSANARARLRVDLKPASSRSGARECEYKATGLRECGRKIWGEAHVGQYKSYKECGMQTPKVGVGISGQEGNSKWPNCGFNNSKVATAVENQEPHIGSGG
ncbi:hypothetical protein B0H13DRAFT_1872100 [Mycena leptocephala]|nr:hypothetical protein B0H13DRAFT_1872100 [Mycena leptocephala]